MARLARVVIPGMPHRRTQRGNRRQPTFFWGRKWAITHLARTHKDTQERDIAHIIEPAN